MTSIVFESIAKTNTTHTLRIEGILVIGLRVLLKQIQHTQISFLKQVK